MKKISKIALMFLLFLFLAGSVTIHADAANIPVTIGGKATYLKGTIVSVTYNGEKITDCTKSKAPAIRIGTTVYVPCYTVFCQNGIKATFRYNILTKKVTIKSGARKLVFKAGTTKVTANGTSMKMSKSPFYVTFAKSKIKDYLVPAKDVAAYLGLKYTYHSSNRTVSLVKRTNINESATKVSKISQKKFLSTIGPIARRDYEDTGVLASVTIAQAILESGWGQSYLAENANNLFGMKKSLSGNSWSGSAWDGHSSKSKGGSSYRKFTCAEDSIADHSAYLTHARSGSHLRYAGLTKTKSYRRQLQIIANGGYCTSGSYVSQLTKIIKKYNLTKYDK